MPVLMVSLMTSLHDGFSWNRWIRPVWSVITTPYSSGLDMRVSVSVATAFLARW